MSTTLPTDASTGSTVDGGSWFKDLLSTGLQGWVTAEMIRAQKRTDTSVTTQDLPRVTSAATTTDTISPKMIWLGVGLVSVALLLALLFRRK